MSPVCHVAAGLKSVLFMYYSCNDGLMRLKRFYLFFQVAEAIKENQPFNTRSQGHFQLQEDDDMREERTIKIYYDDF